MQPRPPALETAAARGAPEVRAMPARRMGCWIFRREVRGVERDMVVVGVSWPVAVLDGVVQVGCYGKHDGSVVVDGRLLVPSGNEGEIFCGQLVSERLFAVI